MDVIKYYHVVTARDSSPTHRITGLLRNPPEKRAERLLSLSGLGDSKPSELIENMLDLLGSGDPSFLFVQLFLRLLPPLVHTSLASTPLV